MSDKTIKTSNDILERFVDRLIVRLDKFSKNKAFDTATLLGVSLMIQQELDVMKVDL